MTDKTTGAAVVTDANQPKLHNQVASRRITDIAVHALLGILAGASMGVAYPKRQRDHTCAIHEDICRAIADRDAVAAHDLMAQHITDHHHYLKKRFRAALEQPIRWDLAW